MVSFSCENCGDVVTKKKLDAHRNFCYGASFTCLDCMRHFQGIEYRDHTSCISEAQKYEGKTYKDKAKRKSVSIALPGEEPMKQPYVEEVPDEPGSAVVLVEHMPQAPSPPPSAPANPVNVFDFLVPEDTPTASKMSHAIPEEQMCMVAHAQPLFKSLSSSPDVDAEMEHFASKGYTYGDAPLQSQSYDNYRTPASKPARRSHHAHSNSTDKKRKRVEELDLSRASRSSAELDEEMVVDSENPGGGPAVLHSGLTGGLNRLLTHPDFPPSPDYSGDAQPDPSPLSPAKRKRAPVAASTTGASILSEKLRGRARRTANGQLVKIRKVRRSSDESRPRKRSSQGTSSHSGGNASLLRSSPPKHRDSPPQQHPHDRVRALEYRKEPSPASREDNQMVVYTSRAEMFLSFVSKGPESEHGYSVNKALKRYHRERGGSSGKEAKAEAEKDLWKSLRLKRNERGEVVVFMG